MSKRGLIGIKISFEDKKIYDNKISDIKKLPDVFKIVRRKLE